MDYTDLSIEFLQTVYRFYRIALHKKLNNAMQGEAFALQFIAQHDDAVVPSDIENAMSVSSARIATVLNGLENKDFITRRIDPADRRRTILKLTPAGEEQAAKSAEQLLGVCKDMLEYLGEEDARHSVRIMSKLADRCADNQAYSRDKYVGGNTHHVRTEQN